MCAGTGLHADRARAQAREEQEHLRPADLSSDDNSSCGINRVNLEHVPGQIEADRDNLVHGWLPSWVSVTAPNVAHCDAGSGSHPLHQWRRNGSLRRKFVDVHWSQGSPIAEEAIGRIAQLYAVEKEARGSPPNVRVELRRANAAPIFDDPEVWLTLQLTTISGNSPLAAAIRFALTRMERLRPYLDNGFLELDNNAAERAMRAIAFTLIETAKLNAVDPHACLADTLARIPDYKITKVDELLPW